jgi:predicted TPR repeat methyltransferase
MSTPFDQARDAFLAGVSAQEQGELQAAEAFYRRSLELLPGRASTLTNLGLVLVAQQRDAEALPCFEQALLAEPHNPACQLHVANTLARLGRLADALVLAERACDTQPEFAAAWSLCGNLLKDLGRLQEAADALKRAIELGADDPALRYLLASLQGGPAPPQPPAGYVSALFDSYADGFDEHLVQRLHYRAPQTLIEPVAARGLRFATALDLGCGTGLCGALLRPLCQRLVGVDLSAAMLAQARQRALYDQLHQADVTAFLQATPERFDLLLAADVFIYIGALEALFAAARRVLLPGGLFAFSVEEAAAEVDYELRPSSRYAQSEPYLLGLAQQHGFVKEASTRASLRLDQTTPVAGLYLWLRQPAGPSNDARPVAA